jgi:hypothetical protein
MASLSVTLAFATRDVSKLGGALLLAGLSHMAGARAALEAGFLVAGGLFLTARSCPGWYESRGKIFHASIGAAVGAVIGSAFIVLGTASRAVHGPLRIWLSEASNLLHFFLVPTAICGALVGYLFMADLLAALRPSKRV